MGLQAEERGAFLDQACGDDPELRVQVEALLAADANTGAFPDHAAIELAAFAAPCAACFRNWDRP